MTGLVDALLTTGQQRVLLVAGLVALPFVVMLLPALIWPKHTHAGGRRP